jgi:hypothetical protein
LLLLLLHPSPLRGEGRVRVLLFLLLLLMKPPALLGDAVSSFASAASSPLSLEGRG